MKTKYIKPEMAIERVDINTMLIGLSNEEADQNYEGGGDVKVRSAELPDEAFQF